MSLTVLGLTMKNHEIEYSADMIADLIQRFEHDLQLGFVVYLLSMVLLELSSILAKRDNEATQQPKLLCRTDQ